MKHGIKNLSGKLIGGVLLVAGVAGIFLYKAKPVEAPEDTTIRPINSLVVGEAQAWPKLHFSGNDRSEHRSKPLV